MQTDLNDNANPNLNFFNPQQLADIVEGTWEQLTHDLTIGGFNYNPEFVHKGDLFIVRHDHWPNEKAKHNRDKIPAVIAKGIAAIMVNTDEKLAVNIPILKVSDTYIALRKIAEATSRLSTAKRVLVIGSYGKTAFKVHLWQLIQDRFNTHARLNSANFSVTTYCELASLKTNTEVLILEKPVSSEEKVLRRAKSIAPDICVLTAIGHEHIEKHGSIDKIIHLKMTFASGLRKNGKIILPADSEHYPKMLTALQAYPEIQLLTFGQHPFCNASILKKNFNNFGWDVVARIEDKIIAYRVPFPEEHAPSASLAELLCAYHLGMDIHEAAAKYFSCTNYKSSGKFYQINYQNKSFYLYDQSERGGIEGYADFFKTLSYLKPQNNGKKIVVTSGFVDHVDGETAYINFGYFQSLIAAANIESLYTVEYFTQHINVIPDKSIWKNHNLEINCLQAEIIANIATDDIVCVKGIFESNLPSFIRYIKQLPSLSMHELPSTPLNAYHASSLVELTIFSSTLDNHYRQTLTNTALDSWEHVSSIASSAPSIECILVGEDTGSWCLYSLKPLSTTTKLAMSLYSPPYPNNAEALERAKQRVEAFNKQDKQRFSHSPIWNLQKKYYQNMGIDSWSKALVPFSATSNAFIAHRYAQVIRAFILDIIAKYPNALDSVLPINIFELGVGHGRFSFMLLKALNECTQDLKVERDTLLYRYIMTDLAEANVEFWRTHPQLQSFISNGELDFSVFDADLPTAHRLQISGELLTDRLQHRPLIVVANFILDVLAYDLFRVSNGKLEQCSVMHQLPDDLALSDPPDVVIAKLTFQQKFEALQFPYYDDCLADQILQAYPEHLQVSVFQFPTIAIQTYRFLHALANECLWLLSEEADSNCTQLEGNKKVGLKNAGSFTSRVNLHALFEYAHRLGAIHLTPNTPDARFDSFGILKVDNTNDWQYTQNAFTQNLLYFGPKDYFRLLVALARNEINLTTDACISVLELGYSDPYFVYKFRKVLLPACKLADGYKRTALAKLLIQSWEQYYDLGEEFNYAFHLGRMLYELKFFLEAQQFFTIASTNRASNYLTYHWLGRSAARLNNFVAAQQYYQKALALNNHHESTLTRMELISKKLTHT